MKMTIQLVIFRAFFSSFSFFRPLTLNLKKCSRKSTNKNILALVTHSYSHGLHAQSRDICEGSVQKRAVCFGFILIEKIDNPQVI